MMLSPSAFEHTIGRSTAHGQIGIPLLIPLMLLLATSVTSLSALDLHQLEGSWRVDNERSWVEVRTIPMLAQQLAQATPDQTQTIKQHVLRGFDEMTTVVAAGVITNTIAGKVETKKLLSWTSIAPDEASCVFAEEQGRILVHLRTQPDGAVRLTAVDPQPAPGSPGQMTLILIRMK